MKKYIEEIVNLAEKSFNNDEIPVGAIVVKNGKIIGYGCNNREETRKICAHAEINAIESACSYLGDWRLNDCVLYTTLFPCIMCYGAILESRISKVYYLSSKTNVCYNHIDDNIFEKVDDDYFEEKYVKLLATFFKNKRN